MSLFLSALPPTITDAEIRTWFVSNVSTLEPHQIKSITLVPTSKCAFVNFRTRHAAEEAALRCSAKMDLDGHQVKVSWGRSRPKKAGGAAAAPAGASSSAAAQAEA